MFIHKKNTELREQLKMAKKEETPKIVLERTYVIPLRMETLKAPHYRKAKKAVTAIRQFIAKHMKSKDMRFGRYLSLKLWEHGIQNPPNKVKVIALKNDKGIVFVELEGAPKEKPKVEIVKGTGKKPEAKEPAKKEEILEAEVKVIKEEKAEEAKEIEKEEIKELQKEHPKQHAPKVPSQPKVSQAHPTAPKSV